MFQTSASLCESLPTETQPGIGPTDITTHSKTLNSVYQNLQWSGALIWIFPRAKDKHYRMDSRLYVQAAHVQHRDTLLTNWGPATSRVAGETQPPVIYGPKLRTDRKPLVSIRLKLFSASSKRVHAFLFAWTSMTSKSSTNLVHKCTWPTQCLAQNPTNVQMITFFQIQRKVENWCFHFQHPCTGHAQFPDVAGVLFYAPVFKI